VASRVSRNVARGLLAVTLAGDLGWASARPFPTMWGAVTPRALMRTMGRVATPPR